MGRSQSNFPESLIVEIWQHQLLNRTDLVTEEGEPIKVIYPGRINGDQGADLLDAVIATSQGLVKGDVEVHVKSSSWWAHRHHQDPVYNRVILHVVFWRNTGAAATLQNGEKVYTLALHKFIDSPTDQYPNPACPPTNLSMPCYRAVARWNTGVMGEILDSAGEERFLAKAAKFQADFAQVGASQSLYQGIMGALGYAKNKLSFLELASRLPLHVLESMTRGRMSDAECLARQQALLLGTAGLLPSQSLNLCQANNKGDEWVETLERVWASFRLGEAMSEDDWHWFKLRPSNSPTRRVAAMSHLILRHREKGILEEVVNRLEEMPLETGYRGLEKMLMVTSNGFWASHFDFGLPSRRRMSTLLGGSRAADTVVNVLLPFTFAWGKFTSQPELAGKALRLYSRYPKLAVNTIERHMRNQLGLSNNLVNSAQRQQGLIHIYKTFCSQGGCRSCPVGGVG